MGRVVTPLGSLKGKLRELCEEAEQPIGKQIYITMSVNLWIENRAGEREVLQTHLSVTADGSADRLCTENTAFFA